MRAKVVVVAIALLAAGTGGLVWFSAGLQAAAPVRRDGAGATAVAVAVAVAAAQDVPIRKRAIGFVESSAVVSLHARIESQIVEQHVKGGQTVAQGDLLFVLDDRDLRAQVARDEATLARDEAITLRNRGDLARAEQLLAKNAGAQQALDQARSDATAAAATADADRAVLEADRLRLGYARIVAPMDGRIGAVPVAPGNVVSAGTGTALATITRMRPLRVAFGLPERDLADLRRLLAADRPALVRAWHDGRTGAPPAIGRLSFLDSAVDTPSGTITVKATFPNDDTALWPGQHVDVELEAGVLTAAVTVPTIAIPQGQAGLFVYVVGADSTVSVRPVTVALADGDRTAIAAGPKAGETVVTEGQLRLHDGSSVRETASGNGGAKP